MESTDAWNSDVTHCLNEDEAYCAGKNFSDTRPSRLEAEKEVFAEDDPRLLQTVELARQLLPRQDITQWQLVWCTTANVARYLRGRDGDPYQASKILAQSLQWRQDFEEVLSGQREPRWQGDLRVVARGAGGHPIIYGCCRHMTAKKNSSDAVDHLVAVLEAWHRSLRQGATQGDILLDCRGFSLWESFQPALMIALLRAIQQPFRDCLRSAIIVDAPRSFEVVWRSATPLMKPATRLKIQFRSCEAAVELLHAVHGAQAARKVEGIMRLNRTAAEGCKPVKLPSEIDDA
uniref:CRAL-TRIO domain-containing protein n=2 Tax=Alexandrium monilatum TaxID=311494 RepID=A0A7S4RBQ4_9DINO